MRSLRPDISKIIWSVALIGALAALLYSIYFVYDHNSHGQRYLSALSPAAQSLHGDAVLLARKTERYLITDPSPDHAHMQANVAELSQHVSVLSEKLQRFDTVSRSFTPGPYLPVAADYSDAVTSHARARAASVQIQEVLTRFSEVLQYLREYGATTRRLDDELASFNATYDLNVYAGRSSYLYSIANDLEIARGGIERLSAPPGLEDVRTDSVTVHTHAIDGFNALAYALSPPIDDLIYSAARQIEAATGEHDELQTKLFERLGKLPAVQGVTELADKVEDF